MALALTSTAPLRTRPSARTGRSTGITAVATPPSQADPAAQPLLRAVDAPVRRTFRKRELVFGRGDAAEHLCILEVGRIKLYRLTPDGREIAVAIVEPGETFGEEPVVGARMRALYAEALEPSRVRLVDRQQLAEWAQRRPEVLLELTRNLWHRLEAVERQMENLAFRKVAQRLSTLLVDWAQKYGEPAPGAGRRDAVRLRIRLTHQELASLIGSSRETVTLTLGQLVDDNLIVYDQADRRTIVIPDLERLAEHANSV